MNKLKSFLRSTTPLMPNPRDNETLAAPSGLATAGSAVAPSGSHARAARSFGGKALTKAVRINQMGKELDDWVKGDHGAERRKSVAAEILACFREDKTEFRTPFEGPLCSTDLPDCIGDLTSLRTLRIRALTKLPERIGDLKSLTTLDVENCDLTELPESIGNLTSLKVLNLRRNKFTELPESIGKLKSLKELDISRNPLTELPGGICDLESLERLLFDNYHDDGACFTKLPERIGDLKSLKELEIYHTPLTELPESIGKLKSLKVLEISRTPLTELPESIGKLKSLKKLKITRTELLELPESIGELKSLTELFIHDNHILELPESIGKLRSLKSLVASNNQLTELPESLGKLKSLRYLSVKYNPLTSLSAEIRGMKSRGGSVIEHELYSNYELRSLRTTRPPSVLAVHASGSSQGALQRCDLQLVIWQAAAPDAEIDARRIAVARIKQCIKRNRTDLCLSALGLTSLPELPLGLTVLDVHRNRLTSLPELPLGLTELNASDNGLLSLPKLPLGLTLLDVCRNGLTSLQELPQGLTKLYLFCNYIHGTKLKLNIPGDIVGGEYHNCVTAVRQWQSEHPELVDRSADSPAIQSPVLPQPSPVVPPSSSTAANDAPVLPAAGEPASPPQDPVAQSASVTVLPSPALPQPAPVAPQSASTTASDTDAPTPPEKPVAVEAAQPFTDDEIEDVRKLLGSGIDLAALATWNASISNPNASLKDLMDKADDLVTIASNKRLLALANAHYEPPKSLIAYHRTLTQKLESVYTNAQVAVYGLHQQSQSTTIKVMGAISSSIPFPGTSVLSSLLVAGAQQNIEVNTTRELKKILACFGSSTDFLAVTNEVAKNVCIGKQKELEAYTEPERLKERSHRAGYRGREVASAFKLVDLFKEAIRRAGMDHQGNLSDSPLRRKAIDDVGTLVDAMIGMSEADTKIMLQDRVRWMTAKLGVVGEVQQPDPAVAGPSHRLAKAVPPEMSLAQMMRELEMQRQVNRALWETNESHARKLAKLEQNLPPKDGVEIVAGRGGEDGNQAQMQVHRQTDPVAAAKIAHLEKQLAIAHDRLNQHALVGQVLLDDKSVRDARDDAEAAKKG